MTIKTSTKKTMTNENASIQTSTNVVDYLKCISPMRPISSLHVHCTLGWVNLYQKFEIGNYTVCGKLILTKKWKCIFLHLAQLA